MTTAREFSERLAELLRNEHGALADFLIALSDFDQRRLWAELGHASIFSFLHVELGLSKGAAHYRKTAAELLQRVPEVIEPLRDGRLCFSTIVELSKVLTPENQQEVLPRFFHRSKLEAKAITAELRPVELAPRRDVVTVVRSGLVGSQGWKPAEHLIHAATGPAIDTGAGSNRTCSASVHPDELGDANLDVEAAGHLGASAPVLEAGLFATVSALSAAESATSAPKPPPRDQAEPLTANLRRFHVTVSKRFLEKLESARAALSHAHPGASAEEILEAGLDLVLARHAQRRGLVEKPLKEPRPAKPDHIPARVKAAVWTRDAGKCQWPLDSGGICGSIFQVEVDHVIPKALGGASSIDGLRCLCRRHNDLAARQAFGDEWMDRFTHGLERRRSPDVSAHETDALGTSSALVFSGRRSPR